MRKLDEVIAEMKTKIPETETVLIERLDYILKKLMYAAPELWPHWWKATTQILMGAFGAPALPVEGTWQWDVLLIYNPNLASQVQECRPR